MIKRLGFKLYLLHLLVIYATDLRLWGFYGFRYLAQGWLWVGLDGPGPI